MKGYVGSGSAVLILLTISTRVFCAEIALGPTASTSFVIDDLGVLYGWGRNDLGQVGNGTLSIEPPYVSVPHGIMPPEGASWKRVSAGWGHTLAITDNGQLYAWGFNGAGRLGTGRLTNEVAPASVALPPGVTGWTDVAAGMGHSLAIGSDGKVYAWGANDWGQLGIGVPGPAGSDVPVPVNFPEEAGRWEAVGAGSAHSVALSQSGELYFWGRAVTPQPEGADIASARPPTKIATPSGASAWRKIGAGYNHSFAIADDGKLYAWGANRDGQLGIGTMWSTVIPQAVINPGTNAIEWIAAAGGIKGSVGLDSAGNLYAWGYKPAGGNESVVVPRPVKLAPANCASGWKSCAAGYQHYLAITDTCILNGWGGNDFAQVYPSPLLGYQYPPQTIVGLKRVCSDIANPPTTVTLQMDSEYTSPADIAIGVSLYDCVPTVVAVTLYEGSNLLATVTTNMSASSISFNAFTWSNVTAGVYTFSAVAVDQFGAKGTSAPMTVTVYVLTNGITDVRLTTNEVDLANALLAWDCGGIQLRETALSAHADPAAMSVGVFQTTPPLSAAYGLAGPGVVMSTGNAADYKSSPNHQTAHTYRYGVRSTPEQESILDAINGAGTINYIHFDVSELSAHFDVAPGYDRIELKVVFGTDEYPEFVASSFVDTFGVLLNGSNIAVVGGAPLDPNHAEMRSIPGTELDGILAPGGNPQIVLSAPVIPGSSNNVLTFILADTSDDVIDTTVYLSELRAIEAGAEMTLRLDIVASAAGELTLQASGVPCGQIAIEGSTDLLHWTDINTNAPRNGTVRINVPDQGNSPMSFFRARRIPE